MTRKRFRKLMRAYFTRLHIDASSQGIAIPIGRIYKTCAPRFPKQNTGMSYQQLSDALGLEKINGKRI